MMITFTLLYGDNLYSKNIEHGSKIKIGSGKKDDIIIPGFGDGKMIISYNKGKVSIRTKYIFGISLDNCPLDELLYIHEPSNTVVYISEWQGEHKEIIKLPYNGKLNIGRSRNNDIIISHKFISVRHFLLRCENGHVRIEDKNSTNGMFVNGKRKSVARLNSGDIVSVFTVNIKLLNGELHFENVNEKFINNIVEYNYKERILSEKSKEQPKYKRSPRTQETLPYEDIVLAPAPNKTQGPLKSRMMLTSLISSGAMMGTSVLLGSASPALIAARAAGMVAPIANSVLSGRDGKRGKKKAEKYEQQRREKYSAYIEDQKSVINKVAEKQREIVTRENPDTGECYDILFNLRTSLWERMPENKDFLDVRVGMGYEDLCVNVKSHNENNGFQLESDELKELSKQIIEETRIVDYVPARLQLRKYSTFGIVGDRRRIVSLVKNLIVNLTTAHCYEDVRIVGFFDEREREIWEGLKWLPHIWDEDKNVRFLSFNEDDTNRLCEELREIYKNRTDENGDNSKKTSSLPHYIILWGTENSTRNQELFVELCRAQADSGFTSLFMFNDIYRLPPECKFIVDLKNDPKAYKKEAVNERFCFTMDPPLDDARFDQFVRRMSAIDLDNPFSKKVLPNSVTFLEGFGVRSVEQLDVYSRWCKASPVNSMAVPIGVLASGKPFYLDIHEKMHGPHGLVAGTTGSGKSELLQTWILSMAVNYHPHDVAFVIIDYKGGGLANMLEPLPHVVGKITNIDSNINRSLVSLESEVKRRQSIFSRCGVAHIEQYQQRCKDGFVDEPLPYLIVVSDEFAELKRNEPEFISKLVAISRIGRSLGIHIVLATQKPGGIVDDQINSNTSFRICLKVQDAADSREMLKRPDASKLKRAGRAYIRVGEDEYFDLFQSYWSGAPYVEEGTIRSSNENFIKFVELSGRRIKFKTLSFRKSTYVDDELHVIVNYLRDVAEENSIKKLDGPWKPELPQLLYFEELGLNIGFDGEKWNGDPGWLRIPIGKYDYPLKQRQDIQYIDLHEEGHYKIFGAPGSGKTTLLKSVIMSVGRYYTPSQVCIYALDCGSWSLSTFSAMPHVGSIALLPEKEKFEKLELMLYGELEKRKNIILHSGTGSLKDYREEISDDLPAILLIVDNMLTLLKTYPDMEQFFVKIASEGAAYGIYLIYTNNSVSNEKMSITNNIKSAIAFELTERGDYSAVVGRLDGLISPKIQGRALIKHEVPVEFQTVMFAQGESEKERNKSASELIAKMNAAWSGCKPKPIPVMPERVSVKDMQNLYKQRNIVPVGFYTKDIVPAEFDLSDNYTLLVTGTSGTENSKCLSRLLKWFELCVPDCETFIFDSPKMSLSFFSETVKSYVCVDNDSEVTTIIGELIEELNCRKRAQNLERQQKGESFSEKNFAEGFKQIVIVVDDLRSFVDTVSNSSKDSMERICRLAQYLGVIFVCAENCNDVSRYNEIESLTRIIVSNGNGIALDGAAKDYTFFRNNLKYNERDIQLKSGYAYSFINGECKKFRIVD